MKLRVWLFALVLAPFGSSVLMTSTAQAVPIINLEPTTNNAHIERSLASISRKARPRKAKGPVAPPPFPVEVVCGEVAPTINSPPIVKDVGGTSLAGRKTVKSIQPNTATASRNKVRRGRGVVQLTPIVTPPIFLPCVNGGVNDDTQSDETGSEPGDQELIDLDDEDFFIPPPPGPPSLDGPLFGPTSFEPDVDTYLLPVESFDAIEQLQEVPEPMTLASFGAGLAGLAWMARRRRKTTGRHPAG